MIQSTLNQRRDGADVFLFRLQNIRQYKRDSLNSSEVIFSVKKLGKEKLAVQPPIESRAHAWGIDDRVAVCIFSQIPGGWFFHRSCLFLPASDSQSQLPRHCSAMCTIFAFLGRGDSTNRREGSLVTEEMKKLSVTVLASQIVFCFSQMHLCMCVLWELILDGIRLWSLSSTQVSTAKTPYQKPFSVWKVQRLNRYMN